MPQYYVNSVSGNDANSGTQESTPFKTITHALTHAKAGDRVQLAKGKYNATSGETFPLKILAGVSLIGNESNKGGGVLVEGGGAYKSPSDARFDFNITFVFILKGQEAAELRGVTIANSNKRGSGVWIEAPTSVAPTVANCSFSNCDMEGVFVAGAASPKILGNEFRENLGYGISLVDNATGEISDNTLENNGVGIKIGAETTDQAAPLIAKNTISRNTRSGIIIGGSCCPSLRGNVIEQNLDDGLVIIDSAQPVLGTSSSLGGNLLRGNCWYDLETISKATVSLIGNTIDPARIKGNVQLQNNQIPSPLPCPATYTLSGRVIDGTTHQPIANLKVEAIFSYGTQTLLTQTSNTNAYGEFSLTFDRTLFKGGRTARVSFKVYQGDIVLPTTAAIKKLQAANQQIEIEVSTPSEQYRVEGQVRQEDGTPLAGIKVQAFDRDLRQEQALGGREETNIEGRYEISYTRAQFCRADKGSADLIVRVYGGTGDTYLAQSGIIFNAKHVEIVDLTVVDEANQQLSKYERLMLAVTPLLEDQAITSLREDTEEKPEEGKYKDLTFLSGETGYAKNILARLVMAHKLAQQAIQPEFWFALLGGSIYQYTETQNLDQQLAAILAILPSLDASAARKALTRSFNQQEIPAAFQENVDNWIEAFLQFIASLTVSQPDRPTFFRLALEDAGIQDADKQVEFARLFNQYKAFTPELLQALEREESFTQSEIADIRTSFQLADLSQGNFSVVKAIKQEFSVRQPEQIRPLAKKSESEWVNLVTTRYAAGEIELPFEVGEIAGQAQLPKDEVYGKMLARQFREAFPTTAFTGGLERALQNGGARGLRHAEALSGLLNRHATFEFLNTSVDDFFKNGTSLDDRELSQDESFRLEVKAVQRVFKLSPNFEATDALLANDLHSAQKVYRLGESEFVRQYGDRPGFTPETARLAWNRAADTHAAVLTIIGDLKAYAAEALPFALQNDSAALANFPNWNNLFQTGDLCECEHCRSVLSPAAYFADLLMFLKDRKAKNPAHTVKDILFARRPDLGFLELNCDNALVPLPYVDVVCEVLEDVVDATGKNDFELVGFTAMPAPPVSNQKVAVTNAVQAASKDPSNNGKEKIELGSDFSLSQVTPSNPDRWVVHGDYVTYLLKKKAPSLNYFAEILRNTKASADELRAYPQYVNPKAYEKLRQAKYPMTLPFDLFAEEVRAGFQKTNLQRWDLMRVFRGTALPNKPSDGEIAAEYFGISVGAKPADPSEKNLILVSDPTVPGQQEIWGEMGNADWLNPNPTTDDQLKKVVGNVKKFLQKTNLGYNELLALLDLKLINPTGDITIRHFDPSCDIDKKAVLVLNAPTLDRIHRFLRLWRKLNGWKMWELDLVIRHPRIGNGALDEQFLINLFYFCQLKNKLSGKTTVEQVCALLGNLNTETRFTKLHEKREDALYQNLFLNKRLIQPLDPAFEVLKVDESGATTEKISDHHPIILAALGIREADLILFKELTKASDGTSYITDDLTLTNLSFLWRHAWLSKLLKFKTEDWMLILKLFPDEVPTFADLAAKKLFLETKYHIKVTGLALMQIDGLLQRIFYRDFLDFACPKSAFEFLENIEQLKATGFSPDELNWLLAGDPTAKSAPKETDATRFLAALRQALQPYKAEYDPTQYGSLSATPSTDVDGLTALMTSLLQKLNRSEAEANSFLATLRGSVLLESSVQGLPSGFTFPAVIVGSPNHIPIQYDEPNKVLRFIALMTDAQRKTLTEDISPALVTLYGSGQLEASLHGMPAGFVFPLAITGAPNNIPIHYDEPNKLFRFNGLMTYAQRASLLNDASLAVVAASPDYQAAIKDLYQQSLKAVNSYRTAIEELYQQSLKAVAAYWSMEISVALPSVFSFPLTVTGNPNAIPIRCEQVLRFTGVMTTAQKNILLNDPSLAAVTSIDDYKQAIQILFDRPRQPSVVKNLPTGFGFPPWITGAPNNIPISISQEQTLRFTGVMTSAQKNTLLNDPSLAAVTNIDDYKQAIAEFFDSPQMAVKFFKPVFTAPLAILPAEVDFQAQLPADLAAKISYDTEQKLLHFNGIMNETEKTKILRLSVDAAYTTAVNTLATQPQAIALTDERIWLTDSDLDPTQPANNTYAKRLANAANKALNYLSKTSAENAVVQQSSTQLGLTEAVSRYLLTQYAVVPNLPNPAKTLLTHLTANFTIDSTTINAWFWANRVAAIWKKWKLLLSELKQVKALTASAQLLDLLTLPLENTGVVAPLERFLGTSRLLRLRDSLPETSFTFFEVLEKLSSGGAYTKDNFADDVQLLNEAWLKADVKALTDFLNLTYPVDYLLAETWERLRRTFYFIDNLNASADTVKKFAAAAMGLENAKTLKELLRSKFGTDTWLTLSAEIQDVLRERKRDALSAYLLTQPQPADAPSGKWENTNDLYAYYLLDVEMCSCQLTSRLVQGSGSVQLFVQRCFMGLEPNVVVKADKPDVVVKEDNSDTAWRWWKWMRKYRVWEANRKVFLWPENWIEPELKKDRSSFFKDLENELLQNEINQDTVEKAFINYLEKLDGVAQLEIAGFYQEDDGDEAIIHVFGRTTGAEPHIYYYRRFDYRQWTPWEKVDLDIQGEYLIPAVVNKRLFLFWPVFTEVPDEKGNSKVSIPDSNQKNVPLQKTMKKLRLQMAVSDYRQGKWTPKRVSKHFHETDEGYDVEIVKKHYQFFPVDRSEIDGRFGIKYYGYSVDKDEKTVYSSELQGSFEISGCKGVPELAALPGYFTHSIRPERDATGDDTAFLKWVELWTRKEYPQNDFSLENTQIFLRQRDQRQLAQILRQTPWTFKMIPPWHLSYLDKLWLDGQFLPVSMNLQDTESGLAGTWLPFFYNDKKRTFFVLPSLPDYGITGWIPVGGIFFVPQIGIVGNYYYPKIKGFFRWWEIFFEGQIQAGLDSLDFSTLTPSERFVLERFLYEQFPEEAPPPLPLEVSSPYTSEKIEQLKYLLKRWLMRFIHYYLGAVSLWFFQFRQFHFKSFYHPFVCDFAELILNPLKGIPTLMSRETQLKNTGFQFLNTYQPTPWVVWTPDERKNPAYPKEDVDFTPDGAFSPYNWELFFHAPLLIANSLSKNQRFEEARDWYHFIFNPIGVESTALGGSSMSKYWITKPFFETTQQDYIQQRIDNILRMLAGDTTVPRYSAQAKKDLEAQVLDWRINPFEPHRIANYRTVAYQKTVVMKYLDNLITWGDNLFRQDSMESINEATQLYILAAEILGPRPKKVPPLAKPPVESFNELETQFDKFSNALVQVENLVPVMPGNGLNGGNAAPLPMLYFCIPQNEKMLGYWDTVADRLYKIRHCMNIEGVVRQLALFEPPIDPGALVKAVAGGVDISSALADLNAPLPLYRFNVLLQKANEVCNDVKALGNALLSALEKNDAEALSLLRQGQEIRLLEAVKALREKQLEEANDNLEGLKRSKVVIETRRDYYRDIVKIIPGEQLSLDKQRIAFDHQSQAQGINVAASVLGYLPNITIGASGFGGSPHVNVQWGTGNIISALQAAAGSETQLSNQAGSEASRASTFAGYDRRFEDWQLQRRLAEKELTQIDISIAAAELRVAIAEKELENHVIQIDNAKATDDFMRSKYTNLELYQWQIGQISGVYFQSYRLAYDLAKRAERCFQFELGLQDSSYINFGYWDSLKKGLLSGEKLQYDLRRLESAYLEQNRREYELTKHSSLTLLDPLALIKLRETGRCFINLSEEIFDLDYPGHYFRRIKSVSITLPCVVGPYTTISCTLRLLKNSIRINTANGDNGYAHNTDGDGLPSNDDRFIENIIPVKAIAASNGQNDSGVFELSFRDERYLPFEGAGAISQWSLELFNDLPANNPDPSKPDFGKPLRQFDYSTITDAILHIKYTAREDAGVFKNGAIAHLRDYFSQDGASPSLRMFNLRKEFPSQWHRFLNPSNPADGNVFELEMLPSLFPIRDQDKTLKVNKILLLARCTDSGSYKAVITPPLPVPPLADSNMMTLSPVNQYGGLHFSQKDVEIEIVSTDPVIKWQLKMTRPGGGNLQQDPVRNVMEVEDLFLVLGYEWE